MVRVNKQLGGAIWIYDGTINANAITCSGNTATSQVRVLARAPSGSSNRSSQIPHPEQGTLEGPAGFSRGVLDKATRYKREVENEQMGHAGNGKEEAEVVRSS